MEIERVVIHEVELPLEEPFVTALKPIPELERVVVEIETDAGRVGLGEAAPAYEVTGETQGSTAAVIEDVLAPVLIGRDPVAIERCIEAMWSLVDGSPTAHAGLEIALHDLRGKVADLPVYQLLGGYATDPRLAAPNVISLKAPAEMAADAADAVAAGYDQLKLKLGDNPATDIERVEAILEAVPADVSLKADANQGWEDAATAHEALRGIGDAIDVIEQPVAKTNVADLVALRQRVDVPVMPDESVESPADARRLIEAGAGDLYNIKLMKTGGLRNAARLNAIAAAADRPTQLGSMVEGHIGTAAGVHFVAAFENVIWNEMVGPFMTTTGITDLTTAEPQIAVSGPGLGVSIDREALADLRSTRRVVE